MAFDIPVPVWEAAVLLCFIVLWDYNEAKAVGRKRPGSMAQDRLGNWIKIKRRNGIGLDGIELGMGRREDCGTTFLCADAMIDV